MRSGVDALRRSIIFDGSSSELQSVGSTVERMEKRSRLYGSSAGFERSEDGAVIYTGDW